MNRTIDVRTEMRKLATAKPVHAAAGAGVLITETLRELPARLAKLRDGTSVNSLSTRANGYASTARTRASREYDKLAARGERALNGRAAGHAKGELSGRKATRSQSHSPSDKA
jgi:hypothetical protein